VDRTPVAGERTYTVQVGMNELVLKYTVFSVPYFRGRPIYCQAQWRICSTERKNWCSFWIAVTNTITANSAATADVASREPIEEASGGLVVDDDATPGHAFSSFADMPVIGSAGPVARP